MTEKRQAFGRKRSWKRLWAGIQVALIALVATVAGFLHTGCDGDSGERLIRTVALLVSGFYAGHPLAFTSAGQINNMNLQQTGDQLTGITDNGKVFQGTIGQVNGNVATFNMTGQNSAGTEATMTGTITVSEDFEGTMRGTYLDPGLTSPIFATGSVPANQVPDTNTNAVVWIDLKNLKPEPRMARSKIFGEGRLSVGGSGLGAANALLLGLLMYLGFFCRLGLQPKGVQ